MFEAMIKISQKESNKAVMKRLYREFCQKYATPFLAVAVCLSAFNQHYALAFNLSRSLPHHLYFIKKDANKLSDLKQGDYVAFAWQGGFYPIGTQVVKEVAGLPGNHVTKANRTFFIDGKEVGTAKEYSLDGMKLAINPFEGEIPQRFMWVKTGHKDSLDSRYELSGLIHSGQIIGKAV
ncbi:S26 family signal peptidase, partial [Neisseria gonorrhoeae]